MRPAGSCSQKRILSAAYLSVSIAKLDGDVPLQLVLEPDGVHARNGLHDGGFTVGHVTDGA